MEIGGARWSISFTLAIGKNEPTEYLRDETWWRFVWFDTSGEFEDVFRGYFDST